MKDHAFELAVEAVRVPFVQWRVDAVVEPLRKCMPFVRFTSIILENIVHLASQPHEDIENIPLDHKVPIHRPEIGALDLTQASREQGWGSL